MFKKGFTLIELLVVIAVIAVLATAVMASINPIEQINKAKDTGSKSDASEFLKAAERYYATFQCYPWETTCPSTTTGSTLSTATSLYTLGSGAVTATDNTKTIKEMEAKQELKPALGSRIAATGNIAVNRLFASTDTNNLIRVCFTPLSKTFGAPPNANASSNLGASCSGATCTIVCVP